VQVLCFQRGPRQQLQNWRCGGRCQLANA